MSRWWLAVVVLLAPGCLSRYVVPLPAEAIEHRVTTSDQWSLSLVQYRPAGGQRGRPVLLCHGISANGRNMDLDAQHSLSRWLASRGRETWTLSLRGTGTSDRPNPQAGRQAHYNFDTFWKEDLTAAIAYVREKTGASSLDYIGHSMGGMLVYAYLSQGGGGLNAVVTLGSPTRLDWGQRIEPPLSWFSQTALRADTVVPVVFGAQLSVPVQAEVRGDPAQLLLFNPDNVTPLTWKRLVATGTGDMTGAMIHQLLAMAHSGRFQSADGTVDYRAAMGAVKVPVMVVAGKVDRLAVAPAVWDGYRALGGPKEWLLLSAARGAVHDYGHMDFVLGERAADELWVHLLGFLDRHQEPR